MHIGGDLVWIAEERADCEVMGMTGMVKRWLMLVAALAVAACARSEDLTRSRAADLIEKALAKQPPAVGIVTGDVEMRDVSFRPTLTPQAADAFLGELQSHGFRWSSVERAFQDRTLTIHGLNLPDQW